MSQQLLSEWQEYRGGNLFLFPLLFFLPLPFFSPFSSFLFLILIFLSIICLSLVSERARERQKRQTGVERESETVYSFLKFHPEGKTLSTDKVRKHNSSRDRGRKGEKKWDGQCKIWPEVKLSFSRFLFLDRRQKEREKTDGGRETSVLSLSA